MPGIKISIITVCYNAQDTISRCIRSVIDQGYNNLEYIIVDGGSTDNTVRIIDGYKNHVSTLISEGDDGIYDAMNKGLRAATGDLIGMLNADDCFASADVLQTIASAFETSGADIVYGDLNYTDVQDRVVRRWRSGDYKPGMFNQGWMPPHPTFYCRSGLFKKLGNYRLDFGTAADYELMLRFIHLNHSSVYYVPEVLINMSKGGVSNKSYSNRFKALYNDFRAMKKNNIKYPAITLLLKPLRKVWQFF